MRNCVLILLLFSINSESHTCARDGGFFQARLNQPPADWSPATKNYIEQLYRLCFNLVTGKPKDCSPKELNKLNSLFDTTSPSNTGGGIPLGIKPDRDLTGQNEVTAAGLRSERKAAQKLARNGYDVRYAGEENLFAPESRGLIEQARKKHGLPDHANFDLLVEGKPFDVYSPHGSTSLSTIKETLVKKSETQTGRIVIYAETNGQIMQPGLRAQLQSDLRQSPIDKLREVLVVNDNGTIDRIFP